MLLAAVVAYFSNHQPHVLLFLSLSLYIYIYCNPLSIAPSSVFSSFGIIPTRRFGRAPPLEDSRAEGMCPNWYKPISMEIYQSITSSPIVSTVLVIPMTPSKPCILVVVSELSFDTDLHSYYNNTTPYRIQQRHLKNQYGMYVPEEESIDPK